MSKSDKKLKKITDSAKKRKIAVKPTKPPLVLTCTKATTPSLDRQSQLLPCDAVFLQFKDQKDDPSVECQDLASKDASLSAQQKALLAGDDLLLQTVADYFDGGSKTPKPKQILITGITSPDCPITKHSHIILRRSTVDEHQQASRSVIEWVRQTPSPQDFLAQPIDVGSGSYRFFRKYWIGEDRVSRHNVALHSCGIKADTSTPIETLSGRIEIYPDDKYVLSVEIPPFYKRKESYSAELDIKMQKTTERKSSIESRDEKTETSNSTTKDLFGKNKDDYKTAKFTYDEKGHSLSHSVSEGKKGGSDYVEYKNSETTQKNSVIDREEVIFDSTSGKHEISENYKLKPAIKLSRNDKELDVTKTINNFIEIARDFSEIFEKIKELVPKVGFTWDISLNVCAGTIEGEWGVRTKASADHPRIWRVERYGSVSINLKIIELGLSAGFGIDYKIENWLSADPLLEVVLKIELTLKIEWPIKTTFTIAENAEARVVTSPEAKASLKGTARASLLGISTFCEAEAKTGMEGKAELLFKYPSAPTFTISGELKPLEIIVTHKSPRSRPRIIPVWKYPSDGKCPEFKKEVF